MTEDTEKVTALQPLGRRARKALAVRQALFDAGLKAFDRQPIGLVSVLDITDSADVAKGVFYLQFRSKDDYLLALWVEVQNRFLELARTDVIESRSQAARLDRSVKTLLRFTRDSQSVARFWLRMLSFFPDEIGEPGHLLRIRQEYIQNLAVLLSGKTVSKLTNADIDKASIVDTFCWAAITAEIHHAMPVLDEATLIKTIKTALPGR